MDNRKRGKIEVVGNTVKISKSDEVQAVEAVFSKGNPTNKDLLFLLQKIWERLEG